VAATLEVITPRLDESKAFAADVARTKDDAVVQALLDMRTTARAEGKATESCNLVVERSQRAGAKCWLLHKGSSER
jgi:hypothetical protein